MYKKRLFCGLEKTKIIIDSVQEKNDAKMCMLYKNLKCIIKHPIQMHGYVMIAYRSIIKNGFQSNLNNEEKANLQNTLNGEQKCTF